MSVSEAHTDEASPVVGANSYITLTIENKYHGKDKTIKIKLQYRGIQEITGGINSMEMVQFQENLNNGGEL